MKKKNLFIIGLLFMGLTTAEAQYTVIHDFDSTNGVAPYSSLTIAGNVLYGVTLEGGKYWASNDGNIFSVKTDGTSFKDMLDFNFSNGRNPYCLLAISGSKLYGSSWMGESNDLGNIFAIDTNGTTYTDLYDFTGANGEHPRGSLILADTILYGTAESGGAFGAGCIFSVDTNGGGYKDLYDFNDTLGSTPKGSLLLSGGVLYGMTSVGGAYNLGCVFSVNKNGTGYKDLHDFNDTNGSNPQGSLIISGNILYGMTFYGGKNFYYGNIFSIQTNGTCFKDLHDFADTDGANPAGDLTLSGNTLYGMASGGGANNEGVIFSINTNGTGFTDLVDFDYSNGGDPMGSLTLSGNMLYGMTTSGGSIGSGVVFSLNIAALTPPALSVSINSVVNVTCNGGSNGSASVNPATGGVSPYTYQWAPVAGSNLSVSSLTAGSYTLTVTDYNGHSTTVEADVAQPAVLTDSTLSTFSPLCHGELTASVTTIAKGGVYPYTYSWSSNLGNGPSINNIAAGSYTLNVTDNNGCQTQSAITITEPNALHVGLKTKACQGPLDGVAEVKAIGGTPPYTYNWAPGGGTSALMEGLSTGTYTVTVTDNHTCFDTLSVTFDCVSTGDNQLTENTQITMYPNPSNGQFNIDGVNQGMNVEIYDYAGRIITNMVADKETMKVDMSNQPNGLYLVRILSKEQVLVSQKKLVKAN